MAEKNLVTRLQRRASYEFRRGLWKIQKHFIESKVVETPTGKFAVYLKDEIIGLIVLLTKQYDTERIQRVFELLRQSGYLPKNQELTFVDIGANIGVVGLQALTMGFCQRLVAIEPEPKNFALLKRNIELNNMGERAVALQVALSERSGSVEFELDEKNFGDHRVHMATEKKNLFNEAERTKIEVQTQPLDQVVADLPEKFNKFDIGWMDIQGFEGQALLGGNKVFATGFPMMMEVCPYSLERTGLKPEAFYELLARYWTHFFVFDNDKVTKKALTELPAMYQGLGNEGRFDDFLFVKD